MASGNYVGNLINWLIGSILFSIWFTIGQLFALFMMWDAPLENMTAIYEDFKMAGIGSVYTSAMPISF